jgi:pentatricopeptide repeat protein
LFDYGVWLQSFSTVILLFMQDAYDHFEMMQREGVCPNQVTYTILVDGHIQSGDIDSAIGLFNKMNEDGCAPDIIAYNTLLRGLCKAGRLLDALSLSYMMRKRGFYQIRFLMNICRCSIGK